MGQLACNRDAIWELACRSVTKKKKASNKERARRWAEGQGQRRSRKDEDNGKMHWVNKLK